MAEEFAFNKGECEDCRKDASHRVRCPNCNILVCPWCWSHVHVLLVKGAPRVRIEEEWKQAEKRRMELH